MPKILRGLTWPDVAALLILTVMGAVVGFRLAVPPGLWFRVGEVEITSAARWQDVRVHYHREIVRPFYGAWRAEVALRVPGGWQEVCAGPLNHQTYTPDAVLPDGGVVGLDWFVGEPPDCYQLTDPGHYRLCTYWIVNEGAWLGLLTRRVSRCAEFEIVGVA